MYPTSTYKSKMGYILRIYFDPRDRIYVVHMPELPGCSTHGNSLMEAFNMAEEAIEGWIECCYHLKRTIPLPSGFKEQVKYFKKLEKWNSREDVTYVK